MTRRGTLLLALGVTTMLAACGNPEKIVVDKYFSAINQQDTATVSSFATVAFDKKVDDWKILKTLSTTETPAPLPDLIKQQKEAEAAVTQNKHAIRNYNLDHTRDVDVVRQARRTGAKVPAKLQAVADTWDAFVEKDHDLKRAAAEAKDRADKERQTAILSVGELKGLDSMPGTLRTRQIALMLTIDGKKEPYTMTLRQYKMEAPEGGRVMSRWVVTGLDPAQ